MKASELRQKIQCGGADSTLSSLYGNSPKETERQRLRYVQLIDNFCATYGADRDISIFSVPGRTELSGNHTDHNRGKVIAGSVTLDVICVASANDTGVIRLKSQGFDEDVVDIEKFTKPDEAKFGTSSALIAGICDGIKKANGKISGFDAYTTSDVFKGSGLSSSAAFEMVVATTLNYLFNNGTISLLELCKIAQYSENAFFGKPCGLMDQIACSYGSIVSIDFEDKNNPRVEKVSFDCVGKDYALCVINTGGNHADLTADFAEIPGEMKAVAGLFGKEVLREVDETLVRSEIGKVRAELGDRAVLRALHFFDENKRVTRQIEALKADNAKGFLDGVLKSGHSSSCFLQNVFSSKSTKEQGLSLALYLCEKFAYDKAISSAWRLQGGGFAGTVQCYVPKALVDEFIAFMTPVFGENSVRVISIRPTGAQKVF